MATHTGSELLVIPAVTMREEFGSQQVQRQAERETAAVQAREEAMIKAEYVMSERHPRVWMNVRAAMLDHCTRPRFADISRYAKPVGKKFINGEWIDQFAYGWTARFAETLRQEMANIKPVAQVTYEDDMIRIVRFGVIDLQKNIPRYREVAFAKTVEKRGKKVRGKGGQPDSFDAPEGREVISSRMNTYGEPTFLVRATEDEMRNKVNSEESKTQRDFTLALCPRDVLEDCLDRVDAVLSAEIKEDPLRILKRGLDAMKREFGILPSDVETYIGRPAAQFTDSDIREIGQLYSAIRDGQTTFQEALKVKFAPPTDGEMETPDQRVERLKRQMEEQRVEALKKEAEEEQHMKTVMAEGKEKTAVNPKPGDKKRAEIAAQLKQIRNERGEDVFIRQIAALGFEAEDLEFATIAVLADVLVRLMRLKAEA